MYMTGVSRQRARYGDATRLTAEANTLLQPLHDDLADFSPSFDGIVYFAVDQWHKDNASAVATVQPDSSDVDRFDFYKKNIQHRRVDLGATALGLGLQLKEPELLKSRMNPDHHTTWTQRVIVDNNVAGGVQTAFNTTYGAAPESTRMIELIHKKHSSAITEVAQAFHALSLEVPSIGDMLELLAPATPNAYIASWDLRHSTPLALHHYGTLRNYLLDTKNTFNHLTTDTSTYVHDTGDGQDISIWLPDNSQNFDRANSSDIRAFGKHAVLPLIAKLLEAHDDIARDYSDITPRIEFVVGLGYVEHDRYDGRTSQAFWEVAELHKQHPATPLSFTNAARTALDITER